MQTRRTVALIVIVALAAILGGARLATAQDTPACANDAAILDRPDLDAPPLFAPNTPFTVTWRLTNTGGCTWGDGYALTPVDAAALGDPSAPLTTDVTPGEVLTVTLALTAPDAPGYHQGVWRLTDAATPFGPWLPLEIEVAGEAAGSPLDPDAAVGDVALPEVLAMSGFGYIAADDSATYYEDPCLDTTDDTPALILENPYLVTRARRRMIHLCNVMPRPGGSRVVTFTLSAATGDVFRHTVVVPDPVSFTDANGNAYTRSIASVRLGWLADAAPGDWTLVAAGSPLGPGGDVTVRFDLAPFSTPSRWASVYTLDNRPVAAADPFAAGAGCHYTYAAGEPFFITGYGFPPSTPVQLGVYEVRLGAYYFADRIQAVTDARGGFRKLYTAVEPGQEYSIYLLDKLDPDAFADDGLSYDPFLPSAEETTLSVCYAVQSAAAPRELPVRLVYAVGEPGVAEVAYIAPDSQWTQYASQGFGSCDSGAPAWASDGALVFHSNCAGSYDLYRHPDPGAFDVTAAPILTTPDVDETDPSVAGDGRIVFRRAAAGADASGELWVLDPGAAEPVALGIQGHAPAWSPDGTRIAYMTDTMAGTWQVYVYDVATGETQLVSVDCPGHCRYPAWSPDGAALVYVATASVDDLTPAGLWLVTLTDGTAAPWQDGPYDQPAWSATGWIVFTGPHGFYRARAQRAPDDPASGPLPYLIDSSTPLGSPAWSR